MKRTSELDREMNQPKAKRTTPARATADRLEKKESKQKADVKKKDIDSFSVKKWIKLGPQKNNGLLDMLGEQQKNRKVISDIEKSLQKGLPYVFAARKEGKTFSIIDNSAEVTKRLVNEEVAISNQTDIIFGAFIEHGQPPLILGTRKTIDKTGANWLFRELLLRPQEIEEAYYQLESRALFQGLLDAADLGHRYPSFSNKLREHSKYNDVDYARGGLVVRAAGLSNTFFLKTFLDLGFSPNSFRNDTGVWAVTVARRHNQKEALKLLAEHGANMNVREETPII